MKFAIFNEIEEGGKKKRRILVEWPLQRIIIRLHEIAYPIGGVEFSENVVKVFNMTVEEFKKESVKLP